MTTSFRAQSPPVFKDMAEAARWSQRTLTAHQTLDSTAIKGPTTGVNFAMNAGVATVTGSLVGIASGLSAVTHVLVCLSDGATAVNNWLSAGVNPDDSSKFDIYVWKPTAAGSTTPIAATSPHTVSWLAIGSQS